MTLNPFLCIDLSISDSLRSVRKSVLIYDTIIVSFKEFLEEYFSELDCNSKRQSRKLMMMLVLKLFQGYLCDIYQILSKILILC